MSSSNQQDEIIEKAKREGVRVEDYVLLSSSGRPIRKATKVIFPDGIEIPFTERMGKKEAIWKAEIVIRSRPERLHAGHPRHDRSGWEL